uniref:Secreted protein n=1 Tax=Romanomermis culicivorax TaxID=13658 RepID=A0A915KG15_ROMCU
MEIVHCEFIPFTTILGVVLAHFHLGISTAHCLKSQRGLSLYKLTAPDPKSCGEFAHVKLGKSSTHSQKFTVNSENAQRKNENR